jgi:hypothetical protein
LHHQVQIKTPVHLVMNSAFRLRSDWDVGQADQCSLIFTSTCPFHTLSSFAASLITCLHLHSGNNQHHAGRARYRHKQVRV